MSLAGMKILIVDDEQPARSRLRSMLEELALNVVGEAANGKQALEQVHELQPDMLLLDIRMPGMDGLETAAHLSKLEQPPAIIFTTAYDEYALSAFKTHAVDYLLKPVRMEQLETALNAATRLTRAQQQALLELESQNKPHAYLSARVQGDIKLIPIEEIYYFQAEHKYVTVGYSGGEVLIDDSLITLESRFPQFLRIHRNALVAPTAIRALEKDSEGRSHVRLKDSDKLLEISRRHLPEVRKWLKEQAANRTL